MTHTGLLVTRGLGESCKSDRTTNILACSGLTMKKSLILSTKHCTITMEVEEESHNVSTDLHCTEWLLPSEQFNPSRSHIAPSCKETPRIHAPASQRQPRIFLSQIRFGLLFNIHNTHIGSHKGGGNKYTHTQKNPMTQPLFYIACNRG